MRGGQVEVYYVSVVMVSPKIVECLPAQITDWVSYGQDNRVYMSVVTCASVSLPKMAAEEQLTTRMERILPFITVIFLHCSLV